MTGEFRAAPVAELTAHMVAVAELCEGRAEYVRSQGRSANLVGSLGTAIRAAAEKVPDYLAAGAWQSAGHAVLQWRTARLLRGAGGMDNPTAYPHLVPRAYELLALCEVLRVEVGR